MKSPFQDFSDELDDLIKNGSSIGVFDLPADYIENLEVEAICSTYIESPKGGCCERECRSFRQNYFRRRWCIDPKIKPYQKYEGIIDTF